MPSIQMSDLRRLWGSFGLDLKHPHLMVTSQWQVSLRTSSSFFLYRWVMTILTLIMVTTSVVVHLKEKPLEYWPVYLTHWALSVQTAHFFLAAVIATLAWKRDTKDTSGIENGMSVSYKVCWVLANANTGIAIWITCGFWFLVYDSNIHELTFFVFVTHGFNSFMVLLDLIVTARPCHLAHFFHPASVLLLYALFTFCFWLAGGVDPDGRRYIYTITDWDRLTQSITVIVVAVAFMAILHFLFCGIYAIRLLLAHHLVQKRSHVTSNSSYYIGKNFYRSDVPLETEALTL